MTPQSNKNSNNQLAQSFSVKTKSATNQYYDDVRNLDETQDLISILNQNLNSLTQAEQRLSFMISEVRSTVKKRI